MIRFWICLGSGGCAKNRPVPTACWDKRHGSMRQRVAGRKNYLFLGSEAAGPRAAMLYTILAGAKRHRIEPWAYVRDLLLRLHADDARLEEMLPDRWAAAHPEAILTHRLDESRDKAARKREKRRRRRIRQKKRPR